MAYGRGHHRNGRQAELAWTPPAEYLEEQARRLEELEAACIKAIAYQDEGLAAKAMQAALLVLRGAVTPPSVVQGVWLVQGSQDLPYVVDLHDVDAQGGRSCNCPDWTHRNGADKEPHACKHICAAMLAAKTQGMPL